MAEFQASVFFFLKTGAEIGTISKRLKHSDDMEVVPSASSSSNHTIVNDC